MINTTGSYHLNPLGRFFIFHTNEIMIFTFSIFIFLFILNIKTIFSFFKNIKKKYSIALFIIFFLGFWLRNTQYRYGQGVDGYFYQDTAKMLYEHNLYVKGCAIGNTQFCKLYHQHLFLPGYPYLISLSFSIFGLHDIFAMQISGILGSLVIVLVFLLTYMLFSDERKALLAALIFTFIPLELFIVPTGATRTTSLFFISLTLLFYLISLKVDSVKLWCLVAITFSYSIYVRQENYVLLIPMLLGLFLFNYLKNMKTISMNKLKKFVIPILIFLITQIYPLHWLIFGNVGWNARNPVFSYKYFKALAPIILKSMFFTESYFGKLFYIPIFSALFFLSFILVFVKKYRNPTLFLMSMFFVYFIVTSSYFQNQGFSANVLEGRRSYTAEYVRYMQHFDIAYAILPSLFIFSIIDKIKPREFLIFPIFLIMFLLLVDLSGARFTFPIFVDGRLNEALTGDIIKAVNKTPPNSLIFISQSTIPNFDMLRNVNRRWIDIDLIPANNYEWVYEEIKNASSIIFIQDYRCRDSNDERCNFIYKNFNMPLIYSVNDIKVYNLSRVK